MRRTVLEGVNGTTVTTRPGHLNTQGKLVLAVIMVLVCVNLYFTLHSPAEPPLTRSVRFAQARGLKSTGAASGVLEEGLEVEEEVVEEEEKGAGHGHSHGGGKKGRGGGGGGAGTTAGAAAAKGSKGKSAAASTAGGSGGRAAGSSSSSSGSSASRSSGSSSSSTSSWWSSLTKPWGRSSSSGGGGGGGGKGGKRKAPPKPSPSRPPPPFDPVTHEHCYAQSDESETCFYHGATCYDGNHIVVVDPDGEGQDARTSMCYDFRHFVASPSCGYNGPHRRHNLPADTSPAYLKDTAPRLLSYSATRKWGPQGRETHYRQVGPEVFTEAVGDFNEELNVTFQWLDGPMYVGGLHHSWLDHTWHFAAATMALFDLKRYNRSAHVDYSGHAAQSRLQTVGAWAAPPMDYLLVAGDYRNVKDGKDLRPWIAHLLTLLVQNHTNVLWNSAWKGAMGVGPNKWLCSKEAVVIGLKPRMFNSIADAHVWRMMAYHYVGIQEPTKDEWPPRRITIITRIGTRNVVNIDEGVALIRSYGLEVNWITEMGHLTFEQQVEAMAKTGILFAIHGAGLANVLFMPAHSVVVEITPYVMYASMYRDLAAASGLYYYRLPSDKPDNVSAGMFYEQPWYDKCDGDDKHISSPAAFLDYECNSRSKSSPVLLNMDKLKATLELALDDIGCRDGYCQEQWWYINMKKKAAEEAAAKKVAAEQMDKAQKGGGKEEATR